jgi:D-mannonate dehydratase
MNTLTAAAMRWFGPGDSVSVGGESRQTGATVVFSPLPGFPADEEWPAPAIRTRQEAVAAAG